MCLCVRVRRKTSLFILAPRFKHQFYISFISYVILRCIMAHIRLVLIGDCVEWSTSVFFFFPYTDINVLSELRCYKTIISGIWPPCWDAFGGAPCPPAEPNQRGRVKFKYLITNQFAVSLSWIFSWIFVLHMPAHHDLTLWISSSSNGYDLDCDIKNNLIMLSVLTRETLRLNWIFFFNVKVK